MLLTDYEINRLSGDILFRAYRSLRETAAQQMFYLFSAKAKLNARLLSASDKDRSKSKLSLQKLEPATDGETQALASIEETQPQSQDESKLLSLHIQDQADIDRFWIEAYIRRKNALLELQKRILPRAIRSDSRFIASERMKMDALTAAAAAGPSLQRRRTGTGHNRRAAASSRLHQVASSSPPISVPGVVPAAPVVAVPNGVMLSAAAAGHHPVVPAAPHFVTVVPAARRVNGAVAAVPVALRHFAPAAVPGGVVPAALPLARAAVAPALPGVAPAALPVAAPPAAALTGRVLAPAAGPALPVAPAAPVPVVPAALARVAPPAPGPLAPPGLRAIRAQIDLQESIRALGPEFNTALIKATSKRKAYDDMTPATLQGYAPSVALLLDAVMTSVGIPFQNATVSIVHNATKFTYSAGVARFSRCAAQDEATPPWDVTSKSKYLLAMKDSGKFKLMCMRVLHILRG